MRYFGPVLFIILCVFCQIWTSLAQKGEISLADGLKVQSATRNVDLTSQIVKVLLLKYIFSINEK